MKIKQIRPLEHNFTKKLDGIAVMPKMLYYYGVLPSSDSHPFLEAASARPVGLRPSASQGAVVTGEPRYCSVVTSAIPLKTNRLLLASRLRNTDGGTANTSLPNLSDRISSVAIVGARKNTAYGEDIAFKMAYELALRGVVVVSGMAMGIDGIAHRGALAANGKTVAVFGTPIDKIHPGCHVGLAREILEKGGALISEYPPGMELNYKRSFLERNRIISGLSDVVIVVEANVRSGSLNTAMHALEQGRELFAVPGDINRPLSQGCNRLIAQGANPYTCVEDVLNFLFPGAEKEKKRRQMSLFGDNENETALLQALAKGVQSGEEILKETGMEASKYNQTVTMLEIKGRIRSLGMNRWTLA